jgi:hypothetical protein
VAVIRHTHVKNSPVNVFLASLALADLLLILICLPLKVGAAMFFFLARRSFGDVMVTERQNVDFKIVGTKMCT